MTEAKEFRAGFVSFVGRPNVGKSTLTNALVGEKIAITSPKPQTTRRAIRAVVHRPDGQIIIVDTPGMHRPRKLLGERLNAVVTSTLGDVDVIGMCFAAGEKIGPGDRFIFDQLQKFPTAKKVAIITKLDVNHKAEVFERLVEVDQLGEWDAVVPVSAVSGEQLDVLQQVLVSLLPVSEPLYEATHVTDETPDDLIAELIRESALAGARDELPHSLAAVVNDTETDDEGRLHIYASLIVERDSQKGIVIGRGGSRLSTIRQFARKEISRALGRSVSLHLQVKVLKEWQNDPKSLGKLGF